MSASRWWLSITSTSSAPAAQGHIGLLGQCGARSMPWRPSHAVCGFVSRITHQRTSAGQKPLRACGRNAKGHREAIFGYRAAAILPVHNKDAVVQGYLPLTRALQRSARLQRCQDDRSAQRYQVTSVPPPGVRCADTFRRRGGRGVFLPVSKLADLHAGFAPTSRRSTAMMRLM